MSEYYTVSGWPATRSSLSSSQARSEMNLISAGFDKMPTLSGNANKAVFVNGAGNALTSVTAATAISNLGLGTISTQDASSVTITGGSISGITDLAVADGGTGAGTAAGARSNLSAVGTTHTGTVSITGQLNADNLRFDGNTVSSTDTNGDIVLSPNGTGKSILQYNGGDVFLPTGFGTVAVRSANNLDTSGRNIRFQHQDGTTRALIDHTLELLVRNMVDGENVKVEGSSSVGSNTTMIVADPDAAVTLYRAGVATARTASNSLEVYDGSAWSAAVLSNEVGSIASQDSSSVTITGGSISGITDLAVADGGTGASTASAARTNLGAVGTTHSGTVSITGQFNADNLRLDGNSISSTDANGNISIDPDGSGNLRVTVASQNAAIIAATGASQCSIGMNSTSANRYVGVDTSGNLRFGSSALPSSNNAVLVGFSAFGESFINDADYEEARATLRTRVGKRKSSGTSRSSTTTLSADPHLTGISLQSSFHYVKMMLMVTISSSTPDIRLQFNATSGSIGDLFGAYRSYTNAGGVEDVVMVSGNSVYTIDMVASGTTSVVIVFEGYIFLDSVSDVELQWAQNTSDASNVTLNSGSFIFFDYLAS